MPNVSFEKSSSKSFFCYPSDSTTVKRNVCVNSYRLMGPLNATEFETPTDGGPDISHWTTRGFPGASLLNKNEKYFW